MSRYRTHRSSCRARPPPSPTDSSRSRIRVLLSTSYWHIAAALAAILFWGRQQGAEIDRLNFARLGGDGLHAHDALALGHVLMSMAKVRRRSQAHG
jgi:hypothetical protein